MTNVDIEKARNATVRKANEMIQKSRFDLSALQQKLVLFLASHINPWDEDFKEYEFKIADFCQICGIDNQSGGNYSALMKTIKDIADKSMWMDLENGQKTLVRWIEKPTINNKQGSVKIRFDNDMKPYLLKLQGDYTQYELVWAIQFKSKYSIRLYDLIKSIHYNELQSYERVFTMEEIRRSLGAENIYDEWKNFKMRVLEPATQEINKYSDKKIEYSPIKQGKAVVRLWIRVESKDYISAHKDKRL